MTRFRVGITAVLTCIAALAIVPSAFAHHGRISAGGGMDCQGVVSYTASSWLTSNVPAKTHNDVRVYVTQSNGSTVTPAQQIGGGQFTSANGFAFTGTYTAAGGVNSVKLQVKEIGPWGSGSVSSNGNHPESSITVVRPSGCAPPPPTDVCPNIAGVQASVPAGMVKDASGNCVTPPPPPTDDCPNIDGYQATVPGGMIKDESGNCITPASTPPAAEPTPLGTVTPAATPLPSAAKSKAAAKPARKAKVKQAGVTVKKKVVKAKPVVLKKQATATKTKPRALPYTP